MALRRGFTLIELLIVVVVILILAGLLMPIFAQARNKARQAQCTSNVRQLAQAALMYAQDYEGHWFGAYPGADRKRLLYPYTRSGKDNEDTSYNQLWNCPMVPRTEVEAGYGWNLRMDWIAMDTIAHPTETVAVCDAGIDDSGRPSRETHVFPPSARTAPGVTRPNPRHAEGCIVGFMDGSARWMKLAPPFYPGPATEWHGNGVLDPSDPEYRDTLWDEF